MAAPSLCSSVRESTFWSVFSVSAAIVVVGVQELAEAMEECGMRVIDGKEVRRRQGKWLISVCVLGR